MYAEGLFYFCSCYINDSRGHFNIRTEFKIFFYTDLFNIKRNKLYDKQKCTLLGEKSSILKMLH